jgi:hypothetical protein
MGRYTYGVGKNTWSFRARSRRDIENETYITVETYADKDWEDVQAEKDVCSRERYRRGVFDRELRVPPRKLGIKDEDGPWSDWISGSAEEMVPHAWYFAIAKCQYHEGESRPNIAGFRSKLFVEVELRAQQENGSELSYEDHGQLALHYAVLLAHGALVLSAFLTYGRRLFEGLHSVHVVFIIGASAEYLSYLFQLSHLILATGAASSTSEILSELFAVIAHVLLVLELAMLCSGYTLIEDNSPYGSDLDLLWVYAWLLFLIEGITLLCGPLGIERFGWHSRDGIQGIVGSVLRVLISFFIIPHATDAWGRASPKVKDFLKPLFVVSSLYILGIPAAQVASSMASPYDRKLVAKIVQLGMQGVCIAGLGRMLFFRGQYYHLSCLGGTALPGFGKMRGD